MTQRRTIGGRHLNSGIRGGLWEKKHSDAMGESVFLFGWLVLRQTTQRNGTGLVLRGKPLTYADITADTGWPERTLHRWMARLQRAGYIEVSYSVYSRMVVRILNAKKFNPKQLDLLTSPCPSSRPEVADLSRPIQADSTPPPLAYVATKSGLLKEGAEFEQKHLGSGAALLRSSFWKLIEVRPEHLPPEFVELCEGLYAAKGSQPLFDFLGVCMDVWQAQGRKIPSAFARAKAALRDAPRREPVAPFPVAETEEWGATAGYRAGV